MHSTWVSVLPYVAGTMGTVDTPILMVRFRIYDNILSTLSEPDLRALCLLFAQQTS
jgi:hypothetical protein